MEVLDGAGRKGIDGALQEWRQGDCVLGEHWFLFRIDFVRFASPLLRRMATKHDKESDEGRALRALREIRVRASPSWDADQVELLFLFIRDEDEPTFVQQGWHRYLDAWLKRVPPCERFVQVDGAVQTLEDLTAREYVESDPLDLDYLSTREPQ